jgi:nucleoside-diphosphate-sugar epimerase
MNIFLTGGTGFLGSHFLSHALSAGHTVHAIRRNSVNRTSSQFSLQPLWLIRQLDEVSVQDLNNCEVLVHLAAHSVQYPYDILPNCLHWNLTATLSLFEKARLAGIRRFIVAGSCFEYGHSADRYGAIPTDAPLEPTNSYAASKAAASISFCQWAEEHCIDLEILRVFHVYGDGESESRFWPSLKRAALAGENFAMTAGAQIRDFTPVQLVSKLFLSRSLMVDINPPSPRIFNIGTGNPCSLIKFAHHWWYAWNAKGSIISGVLPYRPNEVMSYVPGDKLLTVE